jgi:cell division protein ZipA
MANMVKPGSFDMAAMDSFNTPGVSLFMQLPGSPDRMKRLDLMIDTAQALKEALDAELKDEDRSVLTRQTIEHCRQRVRDFELRQLSRK